jgi:hypothetical protein
MDFDEEEAFFGKKTAQKKSEEADIEEMYCDEFEMMDDYMPPEVNTSARLSVQEKKRVLLPVAVPPPEVKVIDMTDDEEITSALSTRHPHNSHASRARAPPRSGITSVQSRPPSAPSLESGFHTSEVINLQHLGCHGAAGGSETNTSCLLEKQIPPPLASTPADVVPAPPVASGLDLCASSSQPVTSMISASQSDISPTLDENTPPICSATMTSFDKNIDVSSIETSPVSSRGPRLLPSSNESSGDSLVPSPPSTPPPPPQQQQQQQQGGVLSRLLGVASQATPVSPSTDESHHSDDTARHRIFFRDILQGGGGSESSALAECSSGYIEGNATSIKKFSVVEKKVKVPHFLTRLDFFDGDASRDVKISSHLCERFLQVSAKEYIEKRNNYIKSNKLDKKEGGNDFKRSVASKFEHFSGRYLVAYIDGEIVLQDLEHL